MVACLYSSLRWRVVYLLMRYLLVQAFSASVVVLKISACREDICENNSGNLWLITQLEEEKQKMDGG